VNPQQQPAVVVSRPPVADNVVVTNPPAENLTAPVPTQAAPPYQGAPVQIALIHYKGTLQRLGCCSPGFFEADEFVAIKNVSNVSQDIRGWTLVNITKGYPSFTVPEFFPCVPFIPRDTSENEVNPAQIIPSLKFRMETMEEAKLARDANQAEPAKIDWAACGAGEILDETRIKPQFGQQGQPLPCVLGPGQSVLVFTNEIHCPYGGFSFNYGLGNIWDNYRPDTAVLYNAQGEEVSRRSYQVK
jgi:hypothetical protein